MEEETRIIIFGLCWLGSISLFALSYKRLSSLDDYWEYYVGIMTMRGIDPSSLKRTYEWENAITLRAKLLLFISVVLFVLPFLIT